jgi:hypothetical protein
MIFLPIVDRELRVRARQPLTYGLRTVLALFALLLCWITGLATSGIGGTPSGQAMFRGMAFLGELIALCGGLFTADCISRERREGTLGLLFLTDLKGYDILLGKAASIGLGLALALLGLVPCLSIPLLVGGVRGVEIIQAVVAIAVALVYSLALGLWVSARAGSSHQAIRRAALLLAGWTLVPLLALRATDFPAAIYFAAFSPAFPFVWMQTKNAPLSGYGFSLLVLLVFSAGYVRAAGRRLRGHWQAPEAPEANRPVAANWIPRRLAVAFAHQAQPPITWLIERQPGHRAAFRWALGLIIIYLTASQLLAWLGGAFWLFNGLGHFLAFAANGLIAWAACRHLVDARQSGELEMLLSTPVGARELVPQHWRAIWRGVRWPLLALVVGQIIQYLSIILMQNRWSGNAGGIAFFYMVLVVVTPINTVLEMLALCWVAMRLGARALRPALAVTRALALVVVTSWLMYAVLIGVANYAARFILGGSIGLYFFSMGFVYLLVITKNILLWRWAKRSLSRPGFLAG